MKNKMVALAIAGVVVLITVLIGVFVVFRLHNKEGAEVVETTEVYQPSESTSSTDVPYAVPEEKPTGNFNSTQSGIYSYSDTTVCATFAEDIRDLCVTAFGEYKSALQDSCKFLFDAGYEYFVAYTTDIDTYTVEDNFVEFTVYLPGARARIAISKDGTKYTTNARMLADDELLSPSLVAPDGPDAEVTEPIGLLPANIEGWSYSSNPVQYDGWRIVDMESEGGDFYTFDSDFITEMVSLSAKINARNTFSTDASLYDMVSFILNHGSEADLMDIESKLETESQLTCYWKDYMFHIYEVDGLVYSDTYIKE